MARTSIGRRLRVITGAVVVAGSVLVVASPAQAAGACSATLNYSSNAVVASCYGKTSGTYFRGAATCEPLGGGTTHDRYGSRLPASSGPGSYYSSAYCLSGEELVGKGNGGLGYVWPA